MKIYVCNIIYFHSQKKLHSLNIIRFYLMIFKNTSNIHCHNFIFAITPFHNAVNVL